MKQKQPRILPPQSTQLPRNPPPKTELERIERLERQLAEVDLSSVTELRLQISELADKLALFESEATDLAKLDARLTKLESQLT